MLYHAVYTSVWSVVTPNSSTMTGLFAAFCDVAWSLIHWLPQTLLLGSALWPQLSGYSCARRHQLEKARGKGGGGGRT